MPESSAPRSRIVAANGDERWFSPPLVSLQAIYVAVVVLTVALSIGPGIFLCILLSFCLSACNLSPRRPDGVPASATYANHTFIECSFVQQSNANLCTVYKDDTGEILAEALFVLDGTQRAAQQSELHYAGFGHRVIYLKNGRRLVPRDAIEASERDPTNRVIRDRLKDLSGGHAAKAIDCGRVVLPIQLEQATDSPSECALRTFAERKPFYVRFYRDHYNSIRFQGFAGDREGNLYEVDYDDVGWNGALLPKETQLLDGGLTVVVPCPKPSTLTKTFDGKLACSQRAAGQNSHLIENRKSSPVLSIEALLANRRTYAHTLVAVRGCYINGEELSALMKCSPEDQGAQRNEIIWVEQASQYEIPSAIRAKLPLSYLSDTQLVFNYREAKDLQPWKRLRIGEVVLFGQFETTDWRDEPTEGGFGHMGAYSHELILVDVLGAADRGRFHSEPRFVSVMMRETPVLSPDVLNARQSSEQSLDYSNSSACGVAGGEIRRVPFPIRALRWQSRCQKL